MGCETHLGDCSRIGKKNSIMQSVDKNGSVDDAGGEGEADFAELLGWPWSQQGPDALLGAQ